MFHKKRGGTVWMLGENFWVVGGVASDWIANDFCPFYGAENFWNRRVALNLQLMLKEKTNQDLLKKAIIYDRTTEEFFIQKRLAGHYANIVKRIRNGSRNWWKN